MTDRSLYEQLDKIEDKLDQLLDALTEEEGEGEETADAEEDITPGDKA